MRGDSLRDFQAKVLAIAGLGVLAGVGALVDNWPTGSNVPPIMAGRVARPEVPVLTPASVAASSDSQAFAPMAALPMTRRAQAIAQPAVVEPAFTIAAAGALPIGEVVQLGAVEATVAPPPVPIPVPAMNVPAEIISLPAPPVLTLAENRASSTPSFAPAFTPADSDPGFVMGTLRKTGSGIAKGGAATGASIMDAFRGVAGAFKKVTPFKDRGFVQSN